MSGTADIPSSFGFPTFLRIFLPGITGSILISHAIMPMLVPEWVNWDLEIKLVFLIFVGTILGVILASMDFYIYQFYEGYRFWPGWLAKASYDRILIHFKSTVGRFWELKEIEQDLLTVGQENEKSRIMYKIRENPYRPDEGYPLGRYPVSPTRLGNVMAEYEEYSDDHYGMHMLMFWHQLWILSTEEVRNFLDIAAATADFLLYMSFSFLIFAPLFGISIVYQTSSNLSMHSMFYIVMISIILFSVTFFISLLISYFFYRLAINAITIYGRNVKAFFDVYRVDLAEKLGMEIELVPDKAERDRWRNFGFYLLDQELKDNDGLGNPFPQGKTTKPE